jgi:hypothetical protein
MGARLSQRGRRVSDHATLAWWLGAGAFGLAGATLLWGLGWGLLVFGGCLAIVAFVRSLYGNG